MKRIFLSALIGIGVVAIFYSSPVSKAAPKPEDYPLVCRGGGGLVVGIAPGERNIGFIFVHGTKPAGEGLAPGECSWVDRGMYTNEPDSLSQHVEEGSESLKVGGTLAAENRWYEELHSADNYWTFMVSNNGRGQLIATSARPNNKKDVSPTARVPSVIGQILKRDLPTARTVVDETPELIILNGPTEMSSRSEGLEGLRIERNMDIPPAPRSLSTGEKTALLKSAGLEGFAGSPTPYVTLTPQQPYVVGRGSLDFQHPISVSSNENFANMEEVPGRTFRNNFLIFRINFETKGAYLITFTVAGGGPGTGSGFVVDANGTRKTFPSKKGWEWQHLNMFAEVAKPGEYKSYLYHQPDPKATIYWAFRSCEISIWNK
jgi:hypothetical protein